MTEVLEGADGRSPRASRRRARTREAILDAAEEVLLRDGLGTVRVEEIAAGADVSVGTIYSHFSGKGGVLVALVGRSLDRFAEAMDRHADPGQTALQRVLAGGDAYLRFHLEHPLLFDLLASGAVADVAEQDEEVAERVRVRTGEVLAAFAGRIDEAVDAGEARPVDAERLTRFLWGAWNGVIALRRQVPGLRADDDEVAATLEIGRWLLREALATSALRDPDGYVGDRVPMPFVVGASPAS